MIWFSILGVLLVLGWYFLVSRPSASPTWTRATVQTKDIDEKSLVKLRATVEKLVSQGRLAVVAADPANSASRKLGPITREFFERYPVLVAADAGLRLALSDVRDSDYLAGFVAIGQSEDWQIVQQPPSDEVFIVEGSESGDSDLTTRYPSLFHFLCAEFSESDQTAPTDGYS